MDFLNGLILLRPSKQKAHLEHGLIEICTRWDLDVVRDLLELGGVVVDVLDLDDDVRR